MNKKDMKQLAEAIYHWRQAYKRLESDPEVAKARMSVERANIRLEKAEKEYRGSMKGNKMVIESILPDVGKSVIAFGIRAKYTREYLRVSFDYKALDRIAEANTRIKNLIMPHRKETTVKARINLEVAEPESLLKAVKFSPVVEVQ